jgi:hypothetical protein
VAASITVAMAKIRRLLRPSAIRLMAVIPNPFFT